VLAPAGTQNKDFHRSVTTKTYKRHNRL
jgi:hypothetical protein